ncbi:ABC transporter family substrate-binding protein [Streptomyces minutiscleroticus]|uniref:ABC transporter family substrate-binding protein n=1 Tax=Streptomyces minutiscleroticus TaxID=68238 RepID=UPI0033243386
MSHDGVGPRAVVRAVAFLTAGVLAVSALSACSSEEEGGRPTASRDIAPTERDAVADGGTLHWAVDAVPQTLNAFQADADATTSRIAGAVLPSLYRVDEAGRPRRNPDFLESAKVVEREPKQVVLYKLNQQAVWSDGREIGAADFAAQWRALSGRDTAYWTARNAGYDRIQKIERGASDLEVRVTFAKPYADWRSLFTPLYPKQVMGSPDAFNDGARDALAATAGPFTVERVDRASGDVRLGREPRWWGRPAKLSELVLRAVPRGKRAEALAAGRLDLADVDPAEARRITLAGRAEGASGPLVHGPGGAAGPGAALRSWAVAHGTDEEAAAEETTARAEAAAYAKQQAALRGYEVRKSLDPSYTQLALNGSRGPLADERVRRAVARALDRGALAESVLKPLGLPAVPVDSHLALAGQHVYADGSGALGGEDTAQARALLADAGWVPDGAAGEKRAGQAAGGGDGRKDGQGSGPGEADGSGDDGAHIVGEGGSESGSGADGEAAYGEGAYGGDGKPGDSAAALLAPAPAAAPQRAALRDQAEALDTDASARRYHGDRDGQGPEARGADRHLAQEGKQRLGGAPGAYAPRGTAAPAGAGARPLAKDGKPLVLRFVLPSGPGSESLRTAGDRIAGMLKRIGIRTEISEVDDASFFKDHIASGAYDLALYSWPASAFPATDARPIYAKPVPAADGSLNVEQNYTRVGTDEVDQLFDQAVGELDEDQARDLMRKADARIWACAGSVPLYQRPQLTAARTDLANAGAFGFQTPVYEDLGFLKKGRTSPGA